MSRVRILFTAAAVVLAAAVGVLVGPSAHAAVGDAICTGSENITYDPGLRLFTQTVTFNVNATYSCQSNDPTLTSGSVATPPGGVTTELSCLNPVASSAGTATVHWGNGNFTRYSYTRTSSTIGGQLVTTTTGTVIEGEFVGDSVIVVVASPSIDVLSCVLGPGITSRTGIVSITIA
jgi:hypothetical protein